MSLTYAYPAYGIDLTPQLLTECREMGQRLLEEVGLIVKHETFVRAFRGKTGVRVEGDRVHLSRELTDAFLDRFIAERRAEILKERARGAPPPWSIHTGGYSIAVIDMETDKVRPATRQDLSDLIKLMHSFGIGGAYPVTPQDVPPLLRVLSCFKICWEESDRVRPFDYMDVRQTPYLFEMHRVMGKPFTIVVNITSPMCVSEHDIEIFMRFYPEWKKDPKSVDFYAIGDYSMLGVSKPITSSGALACYLGQSLGAALLFELFDPGLKVPFRLSAGMPVDLRNMCWAFGSPRMHLYEYLGARIWPALCGVEVGEYRASGVFMASASCAVDARAGMEKMATALTSALQGARTFSGAGNLAVDDLFSGVQLALDVEIFEYVRELVESFSPDPEIVSTEGLYELLRDVGLGHDDYYSHPDTASKVRKLLPVSNRRPSEKLRSWLVHGQNMKDRLRDECLERIRSQAPWRLDEDKCRDLDRIYAQAERELAG